MFKECPYQSLIVGITNIDTEVFRIVVLLYTDVISGVGIEDFHYIQTFQGVGIEEFHCIQTFQGVGIEEFHCIQRCPHFRVLE